MDDGDMSADVQHYTREQAKGTVSSDLWTGSASNTFPRHTMPPEGVC